jgi:peptidoglycan/LPS O-acetylase OafA/YrhL
VLVATGHRTYVYYSPDTRADQLLLGCAFALALHTLGDRPIPEAISRATARFGWVSAVLLAVAVASWTTQPQRTGLSVDTYLTFGMTVTGCLTVALIASFTLAPTTLLSRAIGWRPLAWMGRNWSYGFYLWHWPVIVWFNRLGFRHHSAAAFATTLAASIASWWLIERRFRTQPRPIVATAS